MPINNTKYNYVTKLQIDLCNNSYLNSGIGARHIFTCDPSDTILEENAPYKIYIGSKASKLIHPFSQVSNCQSQLNNTNTLFRIKKYEKVPHIDTSNITQRQKQMQKVVRTYSSNYTMNLASLHVGGNINNSNVSRNINNSSASDRVVPHGKNKNIGIDIKHNSYDRYLARKKSGFLKTDKNDAIIPTYGNFIKSRKFGLVNSQSCINIC